MVELQRNIIPTLSNDISLWKRYVDDAIYLFYKVNFYQQSTSDFKQLSYKHQIHH